MSWSVSASGNPYNVKEELTKQFSYPLADGDAGLPDEGQKETVHRVAEMINQCLDTFSSNKDVKVLAYGHMSYSDIENKQGCYQEVHVEIS